MKNVISVKWNETWIEITFFMKFEVKLPEGILPLDLGVVGQISSLLGQGPYRLGGTLWTLSMLKLSRC